MSVLSERLRELRGSQSQKDMADSVGIKYQAWARYEKGEVAPGADMITQICRAHEVSADWLLGLSDRRSLANGTLPSAGDCSRCKLMLAHLRDITGRSDVGLR